MPRSPKLNLNMKKSLALAPLAVIAGASAVLVFHPGVAYAEPRMAGGKETSFAQNASYTIDPLHSSISFEIKHLGLTNVHGRINKFSGKILQNDQDLTKSSVEFTAQVDSIDTNVAPRDTHLKAPDYFDAAKFPEIKFKSTKIERTRDGYVAIGDLTIRDKTKSISIPFKHYGPLTMTQPQASTRIGVVTSPITLKRSDFGVGNQMKLPNGTMALSDEVTIRIGLEATLDK